MNIEIDVAYIQRLINQLADMHEPETRYTRRSFTDVYRKAREWLKEEMRELGLSVRMDAAANIIGVYGDRKQSELHSENSGAQNLDSRGVWAIGSHTDTVANGGRFDGIAGVVAGLAVVKGLSEGGYQPKRPLEIIDFLAEEPCAFGLSTVGSRGMVGNLTADMLGFEDETGRTLAQGIEFMGGSPSHLTGPLRSSEDIRSFLELHIEQGPVLETDELDIGVVTGIAGIRRYRVTIHGEQGHSGTVPMELRRDALAAASEMVSTIYHMTKTRSASEQCVATVGVLNVDPNHANVIPGKVTFTVEVRSIKNTTLAELSDDILEQVCAVGEDYHVSVKTESLSQTTPVSSDASLLNTLQKSVESMKLRSTNLPSGAGHDAAQIASIAPMAMVFIPCRGGVSHHPDEFSTYEQVACGASVLAETIMQLDSEVQT